MRLSLLPVAIIFNFYIYNKQFNGLLCVVINFYYY